MKTVTSRVLTALALLSISSPLLAQHNVALHDKDVRAIHAEDISYPAAAFTAGTQGVVVVRAKLDTQGNVIEAEAISGSDVLIPRTVENAKKWQFEPNSESAAIIVYNFRIHGVCQTAGVHSQMIFYPPNFAEITGCSAIIER